MTVDDERFRTRYGPWALVAGASDGVGAALARAVAARGIHVVLLARRQAVLDDLASSIRADAGVEARAVAVDLTDDDATERIVAATADLDVGLVFSCAGADPHYRSFLSQPVENAVSMVQRNCVVPLRLCHHFAAPMQARGRGGIVLVSSGAGLVGGANMVAYGASKAFDMVMAEALWAELRPSGVDVLGLVLGKTDTPALRRLLASRGQLDDPDAPVPGAATPEQVVAEALANLPNGPTHFATDDVREGAKHLGAMTRNEAARLMVDLAPQAMGADAPVSGDMGQGNRGHMSPETGRSEARA
jgi:short-subunit dehydrogenase